ncbi:ATP-dependent protease [Vibrio phage D249]|nr:hypothetical protein SIPHO036v1_80012 [Vibrio phage 70E38.1]QZI88020.1 putative ATP-dependent Clp protease proteolytic subunit [Vibrio phage 234P1]QZI88194.1 hypothetical protein SIPHO035v1_p0103 [Vibrio phage 234P7B]QZI88560.1 hypothetical protein SIPHO037v1_p0119 [Vibrio phage 70E35.2]QZI88744.1 hypothetical protein SIPHO039v1_p0115 [Vibrio phage 70E35.5a]QZI88927.1 hypothetical protein SIPHO040v1_p0114 [Vibrio phage 70E35.6]QZI89093.1 hypothetical protein SIPHO042v1_p0096 [Vibrio phage 
MKETNNVVTATSQAQELQEDQVLITVDTNKDGHREYTVYMDKEINRPHMYRNLSEFLRGAVSTDTFNLMLNGPGGHMDTCAQLIHLLANTEARTVGFLIGEINSAHANIFMACDQHVIYPYSMMMVHTFSGGFGGKGKDSLRASKCYNALVNTMYNDLYKGFLSDDEIETVLEGNSDLYFFGEEIANRMEVVYNDREAEQQAAIDAQELAQEDQIIAMASEILEKREQEQAEFLESTIETLKAALNSKIEPDVEPDTGYPEVEDRVEAIVEATEADVFPLGLAEPSEGITAIDNSDNIQANFDGDEGIAGLGENTASNGK